MRSSLVVLILTAILLGLPAPQPMTAQSPVTTDDACPTYVQEALSNLDQFCVGVGRNTACYGNNSVTAEFSAAATGIDFNEPADTAELNNLALLQTAPLDLENNVWGLALMNVQANVPNTLPGQGVVYVLMGDATLENQVTDEDLAAVPDPVDVTTTTATTLRTQPNASANAAAEVEAGLALVADTLSTDGQWLRVTHGGYAVWVARSDVTSEGNLDALAAGAATRRSPMQAFRFSTGVGTSSCEQAAGSLLVQGPNNMVVDIEANGARIRVTSTVMLKAENDRLEVNVLNGAANIEGKTIPQGFKAALNVQEVAGDNGEMAMEVVFEDVEPMSFDYLDLMETYEALPPETMIYQLELEDIEDEWLELGFDEDDFDFEDFDFEEDWEFDFDDDWDDGVADDWDLELDLELEDEQAAVFDDYTIQAGDTLYDIALRYGISVDALMEANGLTDGTIFVGQELIIPLDDFGDDDFGDDDFGDDDFGDDDFGDDDFGDDDFGDDDFGDDDFGDDDFGDDDFGDDDFGDDDFGDDDDDFGDNGDDDFGDDDWDDGGDDWEEPDPETTPDP